MADLAHTEGRLSTSITIRAIPVNLDSDTVNTEAGLRALAAKATIIGAAISFSEDNVRPTTPRYELDGAKAGQMVERTPGLEDITLTLNRVVLYKKDMLEAFGFSDAQSLIDQNIPFVVVKEEIAPKNSGLEPVTTMWTGCWFHNMPKTYDMTGDLRVMQAVDIGATRKVKV